MGGIKEFLGIKKRMLHDREKEVIKNALDKASKAGTFNGLYFDTSNNVFSTNNYKNKEEAINARVDAIVKHFMTFDSGPLGYVISHSHDWFEQFTKLKLENKIALDGNNKNAEIIIGKISDSLDALSTIKSRLENKPKPLYFIDYKARLCYPKVICEETPEDTAKRFVKLIEPLLHLR